jgi:hypothetical protein
LWIGRLIRVVREGGGDRVLKAEKEEDIIRKGMMVM